MISWLFFKTVDVSVAAEKLLMLSNIDAYKIPVTTIFTAKTLLLAVFMLGVTGLVFVCEYISMRRGKNYELFLDYRIQVILIFAIFFMIPITEGEFIYFNF